MSKADRAMSRKKRRQAFKAAKTAGLVDYKIPAKMQIIMGGLIAAGKKQERMQQELLLERSFAAEAALQNTGDITVGDDMFLSAPEIVLQENEPNTTSESATEG